MAAQQPARTSPELRARLHSARANVGITPRPGALPYIEADGIELPLDFGPQEAREIAEEITAAAALAEATVKK